MAEITQTRLKELLQYSPESGLFVWVSKSSSKSRAAIGSVAGYLQDDGYVIIVLDQNRYPAHRLAWLYEFGEMPLIYLDHKNGDRKDNKLENLRSCTARQNQFNKTISKSNKCGFKGVHFSKTTGKYIAQLKINGKSTHIGCFLDAKSASDAYANKARQMHGEFYKEATQCH